MRSAVTIALMMIVILSGVMSLYLTSQQSALLSSTSERLSHVDEVLKDRTALFTKIQQMQEATLKRIDAGVLNDEAKRARQEILDAAREARAVIKQAAEQAKQSKQAESP